MAKAKGGLGRGLGSLLGGMDGTIATPPAPQTEAKNPALPLKKTESEPNKQEGSNKAATQESSSVSVAPAHPTPPEQEPIVIAEDNFTIKGVVEREVPATPNHSSASTSELASKTEVPDDEVDIDLIEPNPDQPRTSFKADELEELAQSIKKNGLLSPIIVRKIGDKYQIIAGERRWQACKSIDMKKVPIRIMEADDDESIILALVENIQRSNLNPIEEAYGYRRMMERGKMTQSEVAQAVSKGRTTITNALRLLELPEDAQQLLFEEKITAGHARAILSIPTPEGRRKLIDKLVSEKLSVRDAERIARLLSGKQKSEKSEPKPPTPKSFKTVARALSESLDADVKIRSGKGGNRIQITFKDEDDLQRLFEIISRE